MVATAGVGWGRSREARQAFMTIRSRREPIRIHDLANTQRIDASIAHD